ncbi:MAG: nucleotide exchange factor GrpE [Crocosphaera sp.]|nr:nucleotide exchange factor GrpE [Crocosphaera sp.]
MKELILNNQQREKIVEDIQKILKEKVMLEQAMWSQQETNKADSEALFLELIEIFDSLESLINYLSNNPQESSRLLTRLSKSLKSMQNKLLMLLEKRQVTLVDFQETQPDFKLCQVVDKEIRNDLEEQTITQVIRQGFQQGDKLLRPLEVIVSTKQKTGMND